MLPRWQPNNVAKAALAHLPIDDRGLSKFAPVKKDMDRHNEHKVSHADVHPSVSNVVIGRFVNERRQASSHTRNPRCSNTEPSENDAEFMNGICLFATSGVSFRQTANDPFDHANENRPPEEAA